MNETELNGNVRSLTVEAWGDTSAMLEMAALDSARQFYGPDAQLSIDPTYHARDYPDHDPRYHANVTIWMVRGE